AEDGIRDRTVTGVQTCALPILLVAVGVLSALGVLSIWQDRRPDGTSDGPKQLVFLIVAIICMGLFQAVNYQKIGRYAWGFYIFRDRKSTRLNSSHRTISYAVFC